MIGTGSAGQAESAVSVLAVLDINKSFPGVQALRSVSFDCLSGEIHGLVGENGAGKSTLMRVLAGAMQPDSGCIRLRGESVVLRSPRHAHDLGIAMVYQDTRLVDDLDVAQNIWLEREPGSFLLVHRRSMEARAASILERLGLEIDLRRTARELTSAERQIVEIARALTVDPAVLILDEPTSALDPNEVERLGGILRSLQKGGTGIVFISHRLPEVLEFANRITVMKDGQIVTTVVNKGITEDFLVSRMVGRQLSLAFPPKGSKSGPGRVEVNSLSSPGQFSDISFTVAAGEIVGLGGIQGNGQTEIARALYGLARTAGDVRLDGVRTVLRSPGDAIRAGIVYVPADRRGESIFAPHSIRRNVAAPHLPSWSRFGILDHSREQKTVADVVTRFQVRTPSLEQPIGFLSGGNQQKVVVGRWVIAKPKLYIFDEPTQGVDVATKLELYRVIRQLAEQGAAVILLSADLLELIGLSDRILVVAHGSIVDRVTAADATEERIIGSAVGRGRNGHASKLTAADASAPIHRTGKRLGMSQVLWRRYSGTVLLLGLLVLVSIYTTSQSRYFLTERNLGNLAIEVVPLAVVAIGQMVVILLGGVDLSVGPSMSLTTALASYVIVNNHLEAAGVILCLVAGLSIGALNSFLILGLRIPDLISTLATYSLVLGLALIVRPSPGGNVSDAFSDFVTMRIGWLPVAGVIVLAICVLGELFLLRSKIGVRLYATGSRSEAAFVAGTPIGRVRLLAYLFSGFMAAAAGLVIAARIGSGDPQAGSQFTLSSIAAVVVGGTSVFGGRGTVIGTFLGAILLVLLQDSLNQLHVTAYYQYIWTGALLLAAVALYSVTESLKRR
jgi:ribose transport system ATP-binding protein